MSTPYEEVLEDIIETVWTEQCGNHEEFRYLGKAALDLVSPGGNLGEVLLACPALLMGHTEGKNFHSYKDENPSKKICFSMSPSWTNILRNVHLSSFLQLL